MTSDAEKLKSLTEHPGWEIVMKNARKIVADMVDIRKIPDMKMEEKIKEIELREGAVSLFQKWIADAVGLAEMSENEVRETIEENIYFNI